MRLSTRPHAGLQLDDKELSDSDIEDGESPLEGTQTLDNVKDLFRDECVSSVRYQIFAERADFEGYPGVADIFRALARSEMSHAEHLFRTYEDETGKDICTDCYVGTTEQYLEAAIQKERVDADERYPNAADQAEADGLKWVGDMFVSMGETENRHHQSLVSAYREMTMEDESTEDDASEEDRS